MSVDFFEKCQSLNDKIFGIRDGKSDSSLSYIDKDNVDEWIAAVHNEESKMLEFCPIDHKIKWSLENGQKAKACDCMLSYNERTVVLFIELKDQKPYNKQWRVKAEEQLKSTIEFFRQNHQGHFIIKAYICNRQALLDVGVEEYLERFKCETGVTLRVYREIFIK